MTTTDTAREKSATEAIRRVCLLEHLTTSIARNRVRIQAEGVRLCAYVSFVRLFQPCCGLLYSIRWLISTYAELLIMVTLSRIRCALMLAVIICRDLIARGSPSTWECLVLCESGMAIIDGVTKAAIYSIVTGHRSRFFILSVRHGWVIVIKHNIVVILLNMVPQIEMLS